MLAYARLVSDVWDRSVDEEKQPVSMRSPLDMNQTVTKMDAVPSDAAWSVKASVVGQRNGIDREEAGLLLTDARAAILRVRAALV